MMNIHEISGNRARETAPTPEIPRNKPLEHWKHEQNEGYLVPLAGGAGWALVFPSGGYAPWADLGYSDNWDVLNGNAHAYTQSADPTFGMWLCWSQGGYNQEKALVSLTPPPPGKTKQCIEFD